MPKLEASEQIVLRRLFRLSYGFNRQTTDNVSLNKLAEKCNLGLATVKRAITGLEMKGMIEVDSDLTRNPNGGNRYIVLTKLVMSLAHSELSSNRAKLTMSYINHDDHDDLNNTDHHQRETMTIYQNLTGNVWNRSDDKTYLKIKAVPLDTIKQAIDLAKQRSTSRPNSLAYFVKEILTLSNPTAQNKTLRKKAIAKIVAEIREKHIGSKLTFSDFVEDVKRACARDSVLFDNDLFNEVTEK